MKKTLLAAFLICFYTCSTFAQQRGSLSLSLGLSVPVGEFASKSVTDPRSGLAKPGGLIDISYMHPLGDKPGQLAEPFTGKGQFGLTATLRGRFNGYDQTVPPAAEFPAFRWSSNNTSWKTAALLVGAYHQAGITRKLQIHEAILVGVAESMLSASTAEGKLDTDQVHQNYMYFSSSKITATSFTALLKAGITYQWTSRFSLVAAFDFWYLRPVFKNVELVNAGTDGMVLPNVFRLSNSRLPPFITEQTIPRYTQPMNSIDLSVGIAMRL